jgi:hypothetical protein
MSQIIHFQPSLAYDKTVQGNPKILIFRESLHLHLLNFKNKIPKYFEFIL